MDVIEHVIQVNWRHRVVFTSHLFAPANDILLKVLSDNRANGPCKALVVLDAALATAQPDRAAAVSKYYNAHRQALSLVCAPLLVPGGEATKNSCAHVEEI